MKIMRKILLFVLLAATTFSLFAQNNSESETREAIRKLNSEIVALYSAKEYSKALELSERALLLATGKLGAEHIDTARIMRGIGLIHMEMGADSKARNAFEKAADIYEKLSPLGKRDMELYAAMLEKLASIKFKKEMRLAKKDYLKALSLRETLYGKNSVETIESLLALGKLSYWNDNFDDSARYFGLLLQNSYANFGLENEMSLVARELCECSYIKLGKPEDFKTFEQQTRGGKEFSKTMPLSAGILNGRPGKLEKPSFPAEARKRIREATIEVKILVDLEGNVISACGISKSDPALIKASEAAALSSKFKPTILDGKPVFASGRLTYKVKVETMVF